jgi:hypothetical protein
MLQADARFTVVAIVTADGRAECRYAERQVDTIDVRVVGAVSIEIGVEPIFQLPSLGLPRLPVGTARPNIASICSLNR